MSNKQKQNKMEIEHKKSCIKQLVGTQNGRIIIADILELDEIKFPRNESDPWLIFDEVEKLLKADEINGKKIDQILEAFNIK